MSTHVDICLCGGIDQLVCCCTARYCVLQVAEEVESQLQKYKAAVDEINSKTAGTSADADGVILDHDELLKRNTQNLMSAVSSLPELQVGWGAGCVGYCPHLSWAHLTHCSCGTLCSVG